METEFVWDDGAGIIRGTAGGTASAADFHRGLTEFLLSGQCPPNAALLLDLRGLDFSTITPEEAAALAHMRVETAELRQGSRTAMLVRHQMDYLLASFLRERLMQSGPPTDVFLTEEAALAWLRQAQD